MSSAATTHYVIVSWRSCRGDEAGDKRDKADEYPLCCLAPKDPVHVGLAGTYWQRLTGRRGGDGSY